MSYRSLTMITIVTALIFVDQHTIFAQQFEQITQDSESLSILNSTKIESLLDLQEIQNYTQLQEFIEKDIKNDLSLTLTLDGPYDANQNHLDKSYALMQNMVPEQRERIMCMEHAQNLSLHANFESKVQFEYDVLENITDSLTNTLVPEPSIIDASFIKTQFRESRNENNKDSEYFGLMIATDGFQMQNGLEELWSLIVKENVTDITALNEQFSREHSWVDVYMYFPTDEEIELEVGQLFKIRLLNKISTECQTTRYLSVLNYTTGQKIHEVQHIHFRRWDDFSIPDAQCASELMTILDNQSDNLMNQIELMRQDSEANPQKILTHCLAGRGRTGTAFAIINSMMSIKQQIQDQQNQFQVNSSTSDAIFNPRLSIFSIVRRMREQRATAVQTQEQYLYIYQFIFDWMSNILSNMDEQPIKLITP